MEEKLVCIVIRGVGGSVVRTVVRVGYHDYFRSVALSCVILSALYNVILYYVLCLYRVLLST